MRAREPDSSGYVDHDGVKIAYEVYGEGETTLVLVPPTPITYSRCWKGQIPELSRHFRVVTFDGRGAGASDRPESLEAYTRAKKAADTFAVMDATDTEEAILVGHCHSNYWILLNAVAQPERVKGLVAISPGIPHLGEMNPIYVKTAEYWGQEFEDPRGWEMNNKAYWLGGGYENFMRFFFEEMASEPHSSKVRDDMIEWAIEAEPEVMVLSSEGNGPLQSAEEVRAMCESIHCPVLVIHGTDDRCQMLSRGEEFARLTGARFVRVEGGGHLVPGREPVLVNREITAFARQIEGRRIEPTVWTRGMSRRRKVLVVSSPIGLGHARRDVAIADELARLDPDLEVEWLAQDPVTSVLEAEGHTIHPASRWLANESAHFASEASGHELNAFQALRRMDEILLANFGVFQDVIEEGKHDLVVADEAWDIDHFWHENPELKRSACVWLTDFVGLLPMPEGGEEEALLTADYNAEMLGHVARYPRIRDRSLFVGDVEDVVPDSFGPGLPSIREWTDQHFNYVGYITGFEPPDPSALPGLRSELGYGDEKVCIVTVGGSGVGRALMEKVVAAYPYLKDSGLRMVVVTGPRIDPESLNAPDGVEVVGFVPRLHRHLSVCDLAVVQGGLTTTMELTAARRPFLYFPLRNHFEQNRHVRHRLERHGAGRAMDFDAVGPEDIAAAMVEELGREVDYVPVPTTGAERAARSILELI